MLKICTSGRYFCVGMALWWCSDSELLKLELHWLEKKLSLVSEKEQPNVHQNLKILTTIVYF